MHVWTVLRYVTFGGDKGGGVAVIADADTSSYAIDVLASRTSTSMPRFSLLRSLSFQRPLKRFLRLTFSLSVVDEHASLLALVARVQDLCKP